MSITWALVAILVILWAVGLAINIGGGLIHLLLVVVWFLVFFNQPNDRNTSRIGR